MKNFNDYHAVKKLQTLGLSPYDLTVEGNLNPKRIAAYIAQSCALRMLFATERVDDHVLQQFQELAKEAELISLMKRMQAGEILNVIEGFPSENRSVLHTAARDFFDHPNQAPKAREATKLARSEVEKLRTFIEEVDAKNEFTDLIMVAIGGSDLGPRAHYYALEHLKKADRTVHFISNVDPDDAAAVLRHVNLAKTLVVVVSKSGDTLETFTNAELVRAKFLAAGIDPKKHFVSVTTPGSVIDDSKNYIKTFYMWDWIGGRYSTTSMCGGVVLAFACGFECFWEFLRGVHEMDLASLEPSIYKNVPLLGALLAVWNHNILHHPTLAVIPYSQPLHRYVAHIQQVEMESNGKRINRQGVPLSYQSGMIIWGEPGTNGQHSFYQLIHQGMELVPLEFVGFKVPQYGEDLEVKGTTSQQKLLSNLFAQAISLATGKHSDNPNKEFPGNRPSHIILGKQLTPYTLGNLLGYFESKIVFEGFLWNINSFDQEGVQLGKVTANKIIDRFAKRGESYPIGDAYLQQLELL